MTVDRDTELINLIAKIVGDWPFRLMAGVFKILKRSPDFWPDVPLPAVGRS